MTMRQAFALDAAVGCLITWGSVPLTAALGVNDQIQGLIAILCMCATAFMVGVIGAHYVRKREAEEGKSPDREV